MSDSRFPAIPEAQNDAPPTLLRTVRALKEVVEILTGTRGGVRSRSGEVASLRAVTQAEFTAIRPVRLPVVVRAALPPAGDYAGCLISVSDGTAGLVVISTGLEWQYMDGTPV